MILFLTKDSEKDGSPKLVKLFLKIKFLFFKIINIFFVIKLTSQTMIKELTNLVENKVKNTFYLILRLFFILFHLLNYF